MYYTKEKKEQESLFVIQEMKKVVTENREHNTGFFDVHVSVKVLCLLHF